MKVSLPTLIDSVSIMRLAKDGVQLPRCGCCQLVLSSAVMPYECSATTTEGNRAFSDRETRH